MNLEYEHLYTFTEIASMEVPLKKSDLLNLVGRLDDMKMLSHVHSKLCKPSNADINHLRVKTSQYSYLYDTKDESRTKKRKIALSLGSS